MKHMKVRLLRYVILILFSIPFLIGCDASRSKKTIKVITAAAYPPFSYVSNGKIVGFEMDLIHFIAAKLGYKVSIRDVGFVDIIPILQSSEADAGAAGIVITPTRKKVLDFSTRHYDVAKLAAVYDPKRIEVVKSLNDLSGKRVGAIRGSIQEDLLNSKHTEKSWQVIPYDSPDDAINDFSIGKLDAFLWEDVPSIIYAQANELAYAGIEPPEHYSYGIAFPKGSFLVREFSDVIIEMEVSGELDNLRKKWGLK